MMPRHMISKALVAAAGLALVGSAANAALVLTLQSGADPAIVIPDNGPGDSNAALGTINNATFAIGPFQGVITVGSSNSPGTVADGGTLQITSLVLKNIGNVAGTLSLSLSDTSYSLPITGPYVDSSLGGTVVGGAAGDSISFQSFYDPANGQPAAAFNTPLQTYASTGTILQSYSSTVFAPPFPAPAPLYGLANLTQISLSPGGEINFSGTTTASATPRADFPEPASFGLIGVGLAALAARRSRKA